MNEQLSLFETNESVFAYRLLEDLNKLETIWKGTFYLETLDLSKWEHIGDDDKVLTCIYKSNLITDYGADNNFIYWCEYKESKKELMDIYQKSEVLKENINDKDLSISITPDMIFVFWHHFERKTF